MSNDLSIFALMHSPAIYVEGTKKFVLQRFLQMLDDNDLDAVIYPVHGSDPTTIGAFTPDFSELDIIDIDS